MGCKYTKKKPDIPYRVAFSTKKKPLASHQADKELRILVV